MSTATRRPTARGASAALRLLLCALALVVFTPAAAPQTPSKSPSKPPLVVVGNSDFAPLSYLEREVPTGLDVDVARAVAKAMGRELRIELMDWSLARDRVLNGQADALIDLSVDGERTASWEFSEPVFTHTFALFVRQAHVTIRDIEDVGGHRVGAAPGGLASDFLESHGGVTLVPFSNYSEALDLLQTGKVDAIAGETSALAHAVERRGISGIAVAGDPFITRRAAFGMRRGNTALVEEMNRAIATLQKDGTLASISDRWRPQEVVFISRGRIRAYVLQGVAVGVLAALLLWISTLKRQIRVRRASEAALRESQERLSLALSAGEMGTWRWTVATGEVVRDASLSAMVGLEPMESKIAWQDWLARVHEDDRATVREQFERSVRERATVSTEFRIVRRDGSMRWLHGQGRPFFNDAGELDYVTGAVVDITDRKLAADARIASEEKFAKAFDSSPDCIAIQEIDSQHFLEINERFEQITGYTRKELLGGSLLQLGMITDLTQREAMLQGLREHGSLRDVEVRLRCKNGEVRTALLSAEVMLLRGKQYAVYVARDVTRQKQLEAHLKRASEINRLFMSELNPDALYSAITQSLSGVVNVDYAGLVLYEGGSKQLQVQAQTFFDGRGISVSRQTVAAGALASVALANGDVTVFDTSDLGALGEPVAPLLAEGLHTICCVPLGGRRGPLGVLKVGSRREQAFTPDDIEVLRQLSTYIGIAIENALTYDEVAMLKNRLTEEKLYLEQEIRVDHNFHDVIGSSPTLRRVLQDIETVAPTESTVLLLGETGTGKELLARAIHELSPRKDRTFVRVDAAALPGTLLESELFGYERGAFTGAVSSKVGRFELAHRGTLFLDEVGEIPLELQSKLLRALQEREFERLGSTRTQRVDVRVIAATNRDLDAMVAEGTFRSDLYYRLNVLPMRVPPLRERPDDIPQLVRHFVRRFSTRFKREIDTIPASTMTALQHWTWPGNVRELEHVIERAVILSMGRVLQVPLADLTPPASVTLTARSTAVSSTPTLADAEREAILRALRETKGVVAGDTGAAARLGMKRTTLQSKMRKLGIRRPSF